jgi:hypothetical protein
MRRRLAFDLEGPFSVIYRPARKLADVTPEVGRIVRRLGAVTRPRPLSYQEITEFVLPLLPGHEHDDEDWKGRLARLNRESGLYAGIVRAKKWGIETEGKFEPLISPATFYQVQNVLAGNSVPSKPERMRVNPLFPFAGSCGARSTAARSRRAIAGGSSASDTATTAASRPAASTSERKRWRASSRPCFRA